MVGQEHLLGPEGVLRAFLAQGRWPSMILFGPPGTGKSGFVRLLPDLLPDHSLVSLNATTAGVSELKKEIARGADRRQSGGRHIVVVDEIHTWSKSQQEVLLGAVESGQIILLGLSNASPYGALIPPLASRVLLFPFNPLDDEALRRLLARGIRQLSREKGHPISLTGEGESVLVRFAGGDGRRLLSTLEGAVLGASGRRNAERADGGELSVSEPDVLAILQTAGQYYGDKDTHYDIISAFIKSVRNYEVDAALHWLARMLEGGEDPLYIARRLVILASEDVGLADPHALTQAVSCFTAVSQIGLPEGRIPLALTTVYLSLSPKSTSAYRSIDRAQADVRGGWIPPVPVHLRDRTTKRGLSMTSTADLEYLYPPDLSEGVSPQEYLPGKDREPRYYIPEDRGRERELKERYEAVLRIKKKMDESKLP
jgi:putative ATPase